MTISTDLEDDENKTTRTRIREMRMYLEQQEEERKKRDADIIARVQRVADLYDEWNRRNETVSVAAKRAVKQFLSSIGWL